MSVKEDSGYVTGHWPRVVAMSEPGGGSPSSVEKGDLEDRQEISSCCSMQKNFGGPAPTQRKDSYSCQPPDRNWRSPGIMADFR